MNFLGKILFSRHAEWQREKYMNMTIWVVAVAFSLAAIVAALMLMKNSKFN